MDECPNCGAKVSSSDKRCSKCGYELKKNSNKLIIGIVLAVIIIAVVGIFASGMLSHDSSGDVKVVNNTDSSTNSPSSDDNTSVESEYWASTKATKFHRPSCEWAQKIKESNKVVYQSREDAINDGREPCGECNP